MQKIETVAALEALYGTPAPASLRKVAKTLNTSYRTWVERAKFCVLTTVGPEGTDASPRGDDGSVLRILDDRHLALPDWHGNNRIDSLRNIVADGRVSLMLMIPGTNNVVRINGTAVLTADPEMLESFERGGKLPRTVTVITIGEIYFQCARALMRAGLWSGEDSSEGLPKPGEILAAMTDNAVGGPEYDTAWPQRAKETLW